MFFISKKLPRQHGLHEPFRHENHPRPITRRQLMGAGFLAGPAVVLAPAWLGALLKAQRADAAGLDDQQLIALQTECSLQTPSNTSGMGTTGPVPFITIDLAGGANLMGSEALAGMAGSPTNFISTAGYNKLGVPGSMIPTSTTFIDTTLGLPFHSDSAILRGIKLKASATALAKVNGVVIPAISQNDTNTNPLNPMMLIAKAVGGFPLVNNMAKQYGQLVTLVGTNSTQSGGNSAGPAQFFNSALQPTTVQKPSDNIALVGSGTGAASQDTIDVMESQTRISGGTAAGAPSNQIGSQTLIGVLDPTSTTDTQAAQAANLALQKQLRCSYLKSAFTAATSKGPSSVDPTKDPLISGGATSIFTATDMMDNDVVKTAAVMKLVMNGFAGAGTIVLGGYDYHSGNRADGETKNQHAGVIIGAILAYADAVQTPVMINVISDGSLTSTGMADTSVAGRGKLGWQGDSQQVAASLILVYSPKGRPAVTTNQIGSLNADGTVNATSSPGANAPNLVPQLVALNWMALNGIQAQFSTVFGTMQGLGAATAQAGYTAFSQIV
jgi:hypothetical protein